MNFINIKEYRKKFFATGWHENYLKNNKIGFNIIKRANLILHGQIIFDDPLDMEPFFTANSINDYKWNKYPGEDPEWCYMLNRQGFLVDLAISYKLTNNSKYLLKYKELIFDFIRNNGIPNNENKNSWRSMDTGIRLQNLVKSFTYLEFESILTRTELDILKQSISIHIEHLLKVYLTKYDLSNWGVLSITGLATVDLFFPELINDKAHDFIWNKLKTQLNLQLSNDGLHWEQSPLYHHQVISSLLYLVQISNYNKIELPLELGDILKKPISSSFFYANNNDTIVPLNDSDRVNLSYVYNIYRHMGYLNSKPTNTDSILFVGSYYEKQKSVPSNINAKKVFVGKESGFYSYKDEDVYFTLFNGLHGTGHGHASQGSFTLDIDNRPILIDSGRYSYMDHPIRIKLKEEQAHNSVSIKNFPATKIKGSWGFSKLAEPLHHSFQDTQYGPMFHMSWNGRGPLNSIYTIRRTVIYIQDFNSIVFYDNIQKSSIIPLTIEVNFNLNDSIQLFKSTSKKIMLLDDDLKMKIWAKKGSYKITEQVMSKIYNQKNKHQLISNVFNMYKNNVGTINVFLLDSETTVFNEKVYQNSNSSVLKETDYVEGIKLENANNSLKLFFLNNEVTGGEKYFRTSDKEGFYGAINAIEKNRESIRLK